jgi:hypothetical protein
VVLGEWLMPGEPAPVYPDWFTSSVKAIYDPAKQGMTNYDVIEAYVEDFTTWNYLSSRGSATVTKNKIIITKSFSNTQNIIEDNKSPYDDIKIYVTGISEDNPLTINQYVDNKWVRLHTYTTDGIYIVKNRNLYVGFGTYITDDCNITITQLPTSILKDLSGNGNHAYLYGGKGKLNSGMGVYKFDFLSDLRINSAYIPYCDRQEDKICSLIEHPAGWLFQFISLSDIPAFKVEVKGIVNDRFVYRYYDENGNRGKEIIINKDGIYELPISYSVENNTGVGIVCSDACVDNVCFTQIPDYPNQLCYDGKMYAVCYDFPILTDYTVMADRTWFDKMNRACFLSKITTSETGAFGFEFYNEYNKDTTYSFGRVNDVEQFKDGITWQITNSYNGIVKLDYIVNGKDNAELYIGKLRPTEHSGYVGCHGKIIIADRSFTEEEIDWIKENIYNIEI